MKPQGFGVKIQKLFETDSHLWNENDTVDG